MQRLILHIIAGLLKASGLVLRVLPVRRRVALLSRQGAKLSLDFQLLLDSWAEDGLGFSVAMCLTDPETKGVVQFMLNTLRQLRLAQTSSVVIVDGYVPAVSVPLKRRGVTVIQMWHAVGAMKKFGYECLDTPYGRSSDSAEILKMHRNYDHVVVGTKWSVRYFSKAFDCTPETIKPIGLPRIDYLTADEFAQRRNQVRSEILEEFPQLSNGLPNVLYAPTFRRSESSFAYDQVIGARERLALVPCNLIVTGHPLDNVGQDCKLPLNVMMGLRRKTIDLLMVADALITDFSAVTYESLAFGVPVFFYAPDADEYRISPGLNVDPMMRFPDRFCTDLAQAARMAAERKDELVVNLEFPNNCIAAITNLVHGAL